MGFESEAFEDGEAGADFKQHWANLTRDLQELTPDDAPDHIIAAQQMCDEGQPEQGIKYLENIVKRLEQGAP